MELDFEFKTVAVTLGMWAFILFLIWFVPFGFDSLRYKIMMTIASLPLTYLMVAWQLNR